MKPRLPIAVGLDLPHLAAEHRLQPIVSAYARRRAAVPAAAEDAALDGVYWPAEFFALARVGRFRAAPPEAQRQVLAACAQGLLGEAYAVEKLGMAYCARLGLLAESAEERMYYAHVGADEATHLRWIEPYVDDRAAAVAGPFVDLVSSAVASADRGALVFLMQVVLEGWGLTHYRRLAQGCEAPALRARLKRVLRDEAAHHGGGRVLLEGRAFSAEARDFVAEYLVRFLGMVRAGPQGVVAALERVLGVSDRAAMFAELDAHGHSAERLALLRGLMAGHGFDDVVAAVVAAGAFEPLDATGCAALG